MDFIKKTFKITFAVCSFLLTVFCMADAVKEKNMIQGRLDAQTGKKEQP